MAPTILDPTTPSFKPMLANQPKEGSGDLSPNTMVYLGSFGQDALSEGYSTSDEEGIVIYDKKKAKLARKGLSAQTNGSENGSGYVSQSNNFDSPEKFQPTLFVIDGTKYDPTAHYAAQPEPVTPSTTKGPGQSYFPGQGNASKGSESPQKEERKRWEGIKSNLHRHYRNSPFVPWTFRDYIDLKDKTVEAKRDAIAKKFEDFVLDAAVAGTLDDTSFDSPQRVPVQMSEKLLRISDKDQLTLVGLRPTIWCKECLLYGHVDWPNQKEYKLSETRLPLPRFQQLDERYMHLSQGKNPIPLTGPKVPRQCRKIAHWALNPVHDLLTSEECLDLDYETQELDMEDVNGMTQMLLQDIDEDEESVI